MHHTAWTWFSVFAKSILVKFAVNSDGFRALAFRKVLSLLTSASVGHRGSAVLTKCKPLAISEHKLLQNASLLISQGAVDSSASWDCWVKDIKCSNGATYT